MLADSMSNLAIVMWVSIALSAIIGVPFTIWYWKRIDKDAPLADRRFKEKVDQRERVTIEIASDASSEDRQSSGTN